MDVRLSRDLLCSIRGAHRVMVGEFFLLLLAFSCHPYLRAQTQTAQKGEFHQSSWGPEDGIGAVFDVQQSQDGYLWLTTSRGVLRFDGVKFENMQEVSNGAIRNDEAYTAMAGRGDYVWLTTRAAGLLLWKHGEVTAFPFDRRCVTTALTNGMVEDLDGSLWVGALSGLYHLNGSTCDLIGQEQGYPWRFAGSYLCGHERYCLGKGAFGGISFAVARRVQVSTASICFRPQFESSFPW
jgi:hypothetical protein